MSDIPAGAKGRAALSGSGGRAGQARHANDRSGAVPGSATGLRPISLEASLYIAAGLLAFLLRLPLLDARPLSVEEGALALESHRLWRGDDVESLRQGPFMAFAISLFLAMFGGDGAVRLPSALAGGALVLTPLLFRAHLGRTAALLAAFGLALSPLMVFASRSVGSAVVPLALGAVLLWLLAGRITWSPSARAVAVAVVAAALVTTGRDGISLALALVLATLIASDSVSQTLRTALQASRDPVWRMAGAVFAGAVLAIGTGLGSHLAGVQWATVDLLGHWLSSFSLDAPRGPVVLLLGLYELPVVLIGLTQLLRTVALRNRTDTFLALWASASMLMVMLQDVPHTSRLILPMFPLYLLAARLVAGSLGILAHRGSGWGWSLAVIAVSLPLVVGYILLNRASTPGLDLPTPYLYGLAALVGVAGLGLGALTRGRSRLALVWLVLAALATGYLVHTTAFLNFRTITASMEPAIGAHPSRALVQAAEEASYYALYAGSQLAIDPDLYRVAGWYLREAREGNWTGHGPQAVSIGNFRADEALTGDAGERRPGTFNPVVDPGRLRWEEIWRWMVDRTGLVERNQRDIILRAPAGNW
jgi:hypothetical protein